MSNVTDSLAVLVPPASVRATVLGTVAAMAFGASLLAAESTSEAALDRYRIPLIDQSISLDGKLDEPAWADALVFELDYETRPGENVAPPARTVCRLFYSPSHLYYGCHAFDPEPQRIRARFADRDRTFPSDDAIGIALDPFNSQNRAFVFDVNPLGVQNDRVFTEASGRSDETWDALWDSAGRLVDDGYMVEVAIPFSSLRFPRSDTDQVWAFNFRRYMPREVFRRIAINPYDRNNPCRLCQTAELVGFADVDPGKNLEVTPTLTGSQASEQEEFPDGELTSADPDIEPGLSVRWGVTTNLDLSGTLNPDFSQVEADVARLDVNEEFALFFPELRPFFLEGAAFFRTPNRIVYTRTLADPAWGLKLTGKQGANGIGTFAARDEVTNFLFPGQESSDTETFEEESTTSVVRYARDVGGSSSTVGMVLTDRRGGDYSNTVAGVDAFLRLGTTDTLEVQALRSETEYPEQLALDFDQPLGQFGDDAFSISYRHNPRNWNARVRYSDFGDGFRADSGFIRRVGFRQAVAGGGYEWFGDGDNWYTNIRVGGDWDRTETQEGFLLEEEYEFQAGFSGQLQSGVFFGGGTRERTFEGVFFDQTFGWISAFFRPTSYLSVGLDVEKGDAIDFDEVRPADELVIFPRIRLTPGRHFEADLRATRQRLDVEGGTLFTADLIELRLVYQINSRALVRAIVQFQEIERDPELHSEPVEPTTDELFGQLLFSYKLDARTAVWVGYTGNYLDEANSGLTETGNTLFFKLSYAWQP
jgi:hypothetical protein